jgi:hypothetical protein
VFAPAARYTRSVAEADDELAFYRDGRTSSPPSAVPHLMSPKDFQLLRSGGESECRWRR